VVTTERLVVPSGGNRLAGVLALPGSGSPQLLPGVLIVHGFPSGPGGGANSPVTFPELAERIAGEMDWAALTVSLSGMPGSTGSFSLGGWLADVGAAADVLIRHPRVNAVWLVGFGTGGALAIAAGAVDQRVRGVASLAAPADFSNWAREPERLLRRGRDGGAIAEGEPEDWDAWIAPLRRIAAADLAAEFAPRPLLLLHGADDEVVPSTDARAIADAHGTADLRIVDGAGHHLRHDPRAVALLLGWLDRQRRQAPL
jgi:uncharacterized protein